MLNGNPRAVLAEFCLIKLAIIKSNPRSQVSTLPKPQPHNVYILGFESDGIRRIVAAHLRWVEGNVTHLCARNNFGERQTIPADTIFYDQFGYF